MKDTTKPIMKPLSDLNLLDRFLFACTMEDVGTMELVLQIILDKEIRLYDDVQVEKEVRTAPWLRSIRLDVVTMDECALYNTEVQKKNTGNLSRRSRREPLSGGWGSANLPEYPGDKWRRGQGRTGESPSIFRGVYGGKRIPV